jgi:hypothetical protein
MVFRPLLACSGLFVPNDGIWGRYAARVMPDKRNLDPGRFVISKQNLAPTKETPIEGISSIMFIVEGCT